MDELEELELLSLVSRVTTEIANHTGINDKTLAEFVISLHDESKDLSEFQAKLDDAGAEFTQAFVEDLDRLIVRLHPKSSRRNGAPGPKGAQGTRSEQEKSDIFKGLSIPDALHAPPGSPSPSPPPLAREERGQKRSYDGRGRDERSNGDERGRQRYRHRFEDDRGSPPPRARSREREHRRHEELDDEPKLYKVYRGTVKNITDFGCFVGIHGLRQRRDGLVHVSNMVADARPNHPGDIVTRGQEVFVKIVKIDDASGKIGLSMREVDQETGLDKRPDKRIDMYKVYGYNELGKPAAASEPAPDMLQRPKKRLTSPEIWELKQLIASGALPATAIAGYEDDFSMTLKGEGTLDVEEDVDIEIREDEPNFLSGQTKQSLQLSPIRVIKAPDGSMNRAAISSASIAKDRRDEREQKAREMAEKEAANTRSMNESWEDPMAAPSSRQFAQDNRQARKPGEMPAWKKALMDKNQPMGKRTNLSIREQRQSLPVYELRDAFLQAMKDNQMLIVVGETGSGKTTQITQYLAEAGYARHGRIGCTQPRRVAATSVAKRVAEEVGCKVGQEVGYTIRFEDCTSPRTKIKYMTDGMLQRECLVDPDLKQYSVIILDEAHERTIATDVLFGLLKKSVKRRPDLKVIITSATLDAEKFSTFFFDSPIFTIPGRTFPVEVMYTKEPESDYLDAALVTVMQIHLSEPPGDILLFLTGQEEIDTSCEILFERMKALGSSVPELLILPVYSALPSEMQSRIFDPAPPGARKVVIATNIAETSITIDGIYYVVDPGFVKQNCYDPKLGMDSLVIMPISQAQARQRAGRAGRTGPGKCFRLYTESAYRNEMLPNPVPEIQRQNLSHTILMLKAMGINDLLHFDFMDPPPTQTMISALENLYALAALDNEGLLTRLGRKMSDFPMEPPMAKVLIASVDMGCSQEMMAIVGMLSVQTIWYRPREKQQQADQKKARFAYGDSDHLTLLTVYNAWKQHGSVDSWCYENFIQARSMKRAEDVRKQLSGLMERYRHPVTSCGRDTDKVLKALCSGFFRNVAKKDAHEGNYSTIVEGTPVYLHPSGVLFGKSPEWVVYHELIMTSKEFMHTVSAIKPQWLVEAAPNFFKRTEAHKISRTKRKEKIEPLFNRAGNDDWRISKQGRPTADNYNSFR